MKYLNRSNRSQRSQRRRRNKDVVCLLTRVNSVAYMHKVCM